jgi:penicillin-binding protein 1A
LNKFLQALFTRIWQTLLALGRFIWLALLVPPGKFLFRQGQLFYLRHRHQLQGSYWRRQRQSLRGYNWRRARVADFAFIGKGALRLLLFLLLGSFVFYLLVYAGFLGRLPSRSDLRSRQNNTASEVYSADSVLLGRYYIQDRTNVRYRDIAPHVIQALVATEDARFYQHAGIDARSLARVFFKTLLFQEQSAGGGSTLSQQLAKNLYPRRHYWFFSTPINKLREYIIARRLEKVYTKPELLELYLNTVPLGGDLYGIERAARRFFNTTADSIRLEEAAVLVGMLKATTTYNPRLHPEKALQRRNVVLRQLVKYGYLPAAKADSLTALPLRLRYRYQTHNDGLAPYFREQLRLELVQWCASQKKADGTPYNLYTDGLKIYTTLHAALQVRAERAVQRRMAGLQAQFDQHWRGRSPWGNNPAVLRTALERSDRYRQLKAAGLSGAAIRERFAEPVPMAVFSWQGTTRKVMSPADSVRYYQRFLNAGLLAIEPQTGYVRAWVGGINHHVFKYDHVRARRQVGSTFKPIVYAAALEQGLAPCAAFPNQRTTYAAYDNWSPRNADNRYGGEYTMRGALAHSINTISAQLIIQTGVAPVLSLAKRLGIKSPLPQVPALALGTASLSLLEMTGAYATLANEGYRIPPVYITRIVDRQGQVIRQHRPGPPQRVLAYAHAATMVELLKGVVEEGSARRLRTEFNLTMAIAGKTGTTQDQADGWFIGITPDLVTGVWVGAEDPAVRFRTLELGQGSNTALPIWGEFMAQVVRMPLFADFRSRQFRPLPPELQARLACPSFLAPEQKPAFFLDRFFEKIKARHQERKAERKRKKDRGRGWGWDD